MWDRVEKNITGCGCEENKNCDCAIKDLGTKCVIFDGNILPFLNIRKNTNLTEALEVIDTAFKNLNDLISEGGSSNTLVNIGEGSEVYKGVDVLQRSQLRSLKYEGELIKITQNANDILFAIDEEVLKQIIAQRTLNITSIGGGVSLYETYSQNENEVLVSLRTLLAGANIGLTIIDGAIRINAVQPTVVSDNLSVVTNGNQININLVGDGTKRFFVNNLYTGATSDGTENRPFKNIADAITAYVGTGTYLTPQYENAKIVVKKGNTYTYTGNFLYKSLYLVLEDKVAIQNSTLSQTNWLIDFDSLPNTASKFNITIYSEGEASINLNRGFFRNSGYGIGSSDNTGTGRALTLEGIRLVSTASTTYVNNSVFEAGVGSSIQNHNNNQGYFNVKRSSFYGGGYQSFINFGAVYDVVFENIVARVAQTGITPSPNFKAIMYGGGYVRFMNSHIVAQGDTLEGVFFFRNGSFNPGTFGMELTNCAIEGNAKSIFYYHTEVTRPPLKLTRCYPYFQTFQKVVAKEGGADINNAVFVDNVFDSPVIGDIDLTRGNTVSVQNTFGGRIVESLIKSPNVLTSSSYEVGTPYINTQGSSDSSNWRRTNVFI